MAELLVIAAALVLLAGTLVWSARAVTRETDRLTATLEAGRTVRTLLAAVRADSVPLTRGR